MLNSLASTASPLIATATFWLSLLAAAVYAIGALVLKRSTQNGVGVWRTTFVVNMATALLFAPLLLFEGVIPSWDALWQPAVVALLFVGGQITAVLALTKGDVSVATPMLGIKILLVAFFTWIVGREALPASVWSSATLATIAIVMLGISRDHSARKRALFTAGCTLAAAACYALFDVLITRWAPAWGLGRFVPIMAFMSALFSLCFIPRFTKPLSAIDRPGWVWLIGGALLISLQALIFVSTLAVWGRAPVANVIYSSRGLWSVILVMALGKWLAADEHGLGKQVLTLRLIGAVFLTIAILILL